jgi:hypothetical protein
LRDAARHAMHVTCPRFVKLLISRRAVIVICSGMIFAPAPAFAARKKP